MKIIPQPQGDIRHEHKTNSDSSERQYIAKVREIVFTSHCTFEFETTRMGESLIDLVHQYPALWDKQNSKYKDSNYKDTKWRELLKCWVSLKMIPSRNGNLYEIHMSDIKISKQKVVMTWVIPDPDGSIIQYHSWMSLCWKEGMQQFSLNLHTYIHAYYFHNVAICKRNCKKL